jgi:hypothetical protein
MNEMYDADGRAVQTAEECVVEVVDETPEVVIVADRDARLQFLGLTNGD